MGLVPARRLFAGFALVLLLAAATASCATPGRTARGGGTISFSGQLSGKAFPAAKAKPTRLRTDQRVMLEVQIDNRGAQEIQVETIVLRGRVMGLTFFSVETTVAIAVPPETSVSRQFSLNLTSLKGQAVGLFRSEVVLVDLSQRTLASEPVAVDVRGSWRSVYAVFGYALAAVTVISFVLALRDLWRHRLSPNRWLRGIRFLVPGLGLGLTLIFALSALRAFLPEPLGWISILFVSSVCGLVFGYLTPTPTGHAPSPTVPDESPAIPPVVDADSTT